MFPDTPLHLSRTLLQAFDTKLAVHHRERIPTNKKIIIISNHRSFLDAPSIMVAMKSPVRFACHYYMSQVPLIREMVSIMGGWTLEAPPHRQKQFFQQSINLLKSNQIIGIFPEGAQPMVRVKPPNQLNPFHRGFAHLALRVPVPDLVILPVAIASREEQNYSLAPLKLLSLFDPSEPLFDSWDWHPAIVYRRINILFGHPISITEAHRQQYRGKKASSLTKELTKSCSEQIARLLRQVI